MLSLKEMKHSSLHNPTSSFGHGKRRQGIASADGSDEDLKIRTKKPHIQESDSLAMRIAPADGSDEDLKIRKKTPIFKRSDSLAMRKLLCVLTQQLYI